LSVKIGHDSLGVFEEQRGAILPMPKGVFVGEVKFILPKIAHPHEATFASFPSYYRFVHDRILAGLAGETRKELLQLCDKMNMFTGIF
jgi:hypothetical protein